MKFSAIFSIAALFGAAAADLHNFCACGTRHGKTAVQDFYWEFDTSITTYACDRYSARQTGSKWWDTCPDCKMDTYNMDSKADTPSCFSWGWHMGGDEFDYYCGLKGKQGYCRDAD